MGVSPGLLLNLHLRSYTERGAEFSKTIESTKPPCDRAPCDRFPTMAPPSAKSRVTTQTLATLVVREGRPVEPPAQHQPLHKKLADNPAVVWRQTDRTSKHTHKCGDSDDAMVSVAHHRQPPPSVGLRRCAPWRAARYRDGHPLGRSGFVGIFRLDLG